MVKGSVSHRPIVEGYSHSTLGDLVERTDLGLEICCEAGGLDREVRWVHVTELPDPTPYLREAELVLTNGLWLEQGVDASEYVLRLGSSRAAGLMFGLLAERPEAPSELVEACEAAGLVLLTLPVEVPFTAVSEAMAELQAESRVRELSQAVSRSNALAQAVIQGVDEQGVLNLLTHDFELPVALVDAGGHVLASEGVAARAIDGDAVRRALAGPTRAEVTFSDGRIASIFAIRVLDEPQAALVCVRPLVDLSTVERSAIKQTVRFLTLDLTRRHTSHAIESRFAGELLDMVNDARRNHELPGRLRSFAIDPDGPLAVLSVTFADRASSTNGDGPPMAELAKLLSHVLLRRGIRAVVPERADDVVAILSWAGDEDALALAAQEIASACAREWSDRRVVVGVGGIVEDHGHLRRGVLEAREARRVAQRSQSGPTVARFEEIGSHHMLMGMHEDHTLREFAAAVLRPLREYDESRQTELEHTLRTFLHLDGRLNDSAEALFVHVNTLRNRLGRIEELTGRDLSSTDDRVDLYLALGVSGSGQDGVPTYRALAEN